MNINNTLYERKHHYVTILKESEVLKKQMNEELLDGAIEAARLDEINHICNLAFAGLLQEGLAFTYARDTDVSKESIIMTIDHVDYRCRVGALRNILRGRFDEIVNKNSSLGTGFQNQPAQDASLTKTPAYAYEAPRVKEEPQSAPAPVPAYEAPKAEVESPVQKTPENKPLTTERLTDTNLHKDASETLDASPEIRNTPQWAFSSAAESEIAATQQEPVKEAPASVLNEDAPEEQREENFFDTNGDFSDAAINKLLESLMQKELNEFLNETNDAPSSASEKRFESQAHTESESSQNGVETHLSKEEPASTVTETATMVAENTPTKAPVVETPPVMEIPVLLDETEKNADSFCYQIHKVSVAHAGESRNEEIYFMVAPLEIEENNVSTPIVAYAFHNNHVYMASSRDNNDPGKNLLIMQIGDYELLIRGVFSNYKFTSHIFTSANSSHMDDTIAPLYNKESNPLPIKAKNGHIKFTYDGKLEGERGTVEVFPVTEYTEGKDNFIVLHKIERANGETFGYKYATEENKKILLQTRDGLKELICHWEGDVAKAEIIPA